MPNEYEGQYLRNAFCSSPSVRRAHVYLTLLESHFQRVITNAAEAVVSLAEWGHSTRLSLT